MRQAKELHRHTDCQKPNVKKSITINLIIIIRFNVRKPDIKTFAKSFMFHTNTVPHPLLSGYDEYHVK